MSKQLPRLVAAMASVAIFNFIVKAIGASKDLVVAHHFGTNDALDAFFLALLVQIFIVNTVSASLGDAFLPVFVRVRDRDGRARAVAVMQSVMTLGAIGMCALALLTAALAHPLVHALAPAFSADKQQLACTLLYYLLPTVVIAGVTAPFAATLNASGHYRLAASVPGITPLVTLSLLLAFGTRYGAYPLVVGMLIGAVLEAGTMAYALRALDLATVPAWRGYDPDLRRTMSQALPLVAASFLATSTTVVDQSMASYLGSGAVSAFNYGSKVVALALGIGGLAIGNVIFPEFARLVAERDWAEVKRILSTYVRWTFILALCGTVVGISVSPVVVRLLFQRGSFTAADTEVVSAIQRLFLIQVPFHLGGLVMVRLLSALGRNQLLIVTGIINVSVNIVANWFLMRRLGPAGIALSTSLVFAVGFGVLWVASRHELARRMEGDA